MIGGVILRFLLLVMAVSLNFNVKAASYYYIFSPIDKVSMSSENLVVGDENLNAQAMLRGKVGVHDTRVLFSTCVGTPSSGPHWAVDRAYVIIPKRAELRDGTYVDINVLNSNGWDNINSPGIGNKYHVMRISQNKVYSVFSGCKPVGLTQRNSMFWQDLLLNVSIKKQTIPPGKHTFLIPYFYGNSRSGSFGSPPKPINDEAGLIFKHGQKLEFALNMDVDSKCLLSDYGPISLSHGRMTPEESIGNQTNPYNMSISCDYESSVTVRLTGKEQVFGKTSNFTQCGPGGVCELVFNGSEYDKTFKVGGNLNLAITSKFHPEEGDPIEGAFSGGGVLTITYD